MATRGPALCFCVCPAPKSFQQVFHILMTMINNEWTRFWFSKIKGHGDQYGPKCITLSLTWVKWTMFTLALAINTNLGIVRCLGKFKTWRTRLKYYLSGRCCNCAPGYPTDLYTIKQYLYFIACKFTSSHFLFTWPLKCHSWIYILM